VQTLAGGITRETRVTIGEDNPRPPGHANSGPAKSPNLSAQNKYTIVLISSGFDAQKTAQSAPQSIGSISSSDNVCRLDPQEFVESE
jgi:hypothetical protein